MIRRKLMINLIPDAKLAVRQKGEDISPAGTQDIPMKLEKQEEVSHETKDNFKDNDNNKQKKDDTVPKESAKPQDKSRPISSTPVPGTPWRVLSSESR